MHKLYFISYLERCLEAGTVHLLKLEQWFMNHKAYPAKAWGLEACRSRNEGSSLNDEAHCACHCCPMPMLKGWSPCWRLAEACCLSHHLHTQPFEFRNQNQKHIGENHSRLSKWSFSIKGACMSWWPNFFGACILWSKGLLTVDTAVKLQGWCRWLLAA